MINCILCGVGGQGTVLASKLIAQSAINRGAYVRTAETIGMAQRGGCVVSHVRIDPAGPSPMVPLGQADLIIGFEPAETLRALPYLKPDGAVVCATRAVQPVTATLSGQSYDPQPLLSQLRDRFARLVLVDGDAICRACGSAKALNVALLGAAVATGTLGVNMDQMLQALEMKVAPRFLKMNQQALALGAEAGGQAQ